jgi:hypothetical protein
MSNITQQEFFTIADLYPRVINLWCTSGSLQTPTTVLGVTVPFVDKENNNVRSTLQQIETVTLPVDNDPGTTVELKITSRVIRGISPNEYYFFTVQPKDISTYVNPVANEVVQNGEVILSPNLRGGSFFTSDYNILLNIAQNNRTSEYIQIINSTTLASIQDSLYSDTGWINGRYEGSVTNKQTYASIDSAIQGASFQGTFYPSSTPDTEIQNIDVSERSYSEYFHTGLQTYPSYSLSIPALFRTADSSTSQLSTNITVFPITENNKPFKTYEPGDLIQIAQLPASTEVMKVISMTRLSANNDYNIEVVRGWNNTVKAELAPLADIFNINTIRIFELEGNKPSPARQGKIRIKDTGYILYVDLLGYVISGSAPAI